MFKFNHQFFEKHQKTLIFVANKRYLRWLLGLRRLPEELKSLRIDRITPNSVHSVIELSYTKKGRPRQKVKAVFFTRPRFAEALAYNFSPFVYLANARQTKMIWRFSPAGLVGCLLLVLFPYKIGGFAFFGTTDTFYPDPNPETTSVDGSVFRNNPGGESFAVLRAGAGTDALDNHAYNEPCAGYGHLTGSGNWYRLYRGIFGFDTSALPDGASISAATFAIYGKSKTDGISITPKIGITKGYSASNTALVASDFNVSNWENTRYCDTDITYAGFSTTGYNTYTLNASGIANINKTGVSKFGTRTDGDIDNSSNPGGSTLADSYFAVYYSDQTGTSNDPYLSVTYATGATVSVSDTFTLSEANSNLRTRLTSISDTFTISESVSAAKAILVSVSDSIGLTEALNSLRGLKTSVSDTFTLSESLSSLRARLLSVSDTINLSESIAAVKAKLIQVSDTIGMTEGLSFVRTFVARVSDTIGLTEIVRAINPNQIWQNKTKYSSTWTNKSKN